MSRAPDPPNERSRGVFSARRTRPLRTADGRSVRGIGAAAAVSAALVAVAQLGWNAAVPGGAIPAGAVLLGAATAALAAGATLLVWSRRLAESEREARARTEAELEELRTLLAAVAEHVPAALLVLDRELRVVGANRLASEVHGGELEDGRTCHEALHGMKESCPGCPAVATLEHRETDMVGPWSEPHTGEVLSVESHALRLPDGREYVLLVERIVTEQKKLQARLVHQEKMAAFGLLAAGIAHEVGNPLSSIEMQLQLVDDRSLPEGAVIVLGNVRQELARLRRILRDIVDFARRRREDASLVSVQSVVSDALRLVRHDPRARHLRIDESYDPETPPVAIVEDHLMQVVLNLLINAVDAMPDGGALRIELRPADGRVVLRIHDEGVGMEHAVLTKCFEPLFTTKPPGAGTGLGLSVSRDLVAAAGGDIELHSSPGAGTTAVVVLPSASATECAEEAA